jgi:hypothetical protein
MLKLRWVRLYSPFTPVERGAMSAARDLFIELFTHRPMLHPGDRESVEILRNAADQWRTDGRFFSAGVCMSTAIHGAWGDGAEVDRCLVQAVQDYRACIDTQPPDSLESLAALRKWTGLLMYVERAIASHWQRVLQQELAERLMRFFDETTQRDSYLAKGFVLTTDLDGHWEVTCPDYEVSAWPGDRDRRPDLIWNTFCFSPADHAWRFCGCAPDCRALSRCVHHTGT